MSKTYLTEAFGELKLLDEEVFNVTANGITEFEDIVNDDAESFETIIDPLAETEEELQDSYLGKAILDCIICQSKIYKDPEDVVINEEETLANIGDECPYCQSVDGYKVIGQVAEFKPVAEEPVEEVAEEEEVAVEEAPEDETMEEAIKTKAGVKRTRLLKEERETVVTPETSVKSAVAIITPDEFQLDQVRDDLTIAELWDKMQQGEDVYKVASTDGDGFDSEVRETIFNAISEAFDIDYDVVYNQWLSNGDDNDAVMNEDFNKVNEAYSTNIDLDNNVVSIENDDLDYLCIDFSEIDLKRSEFNTLVSKDVSFDEKVKLIDRLSSKSRSLLHAPSDEWLDIDSISKRNLKKLIDACIEFLKNNESSIYIEEDTDLNEDFNKVNIETDETKMTMTSDENGKVTVTTEPTGGNIDVEETEEMIAPVTDEVEAKFEVGTEDDEYEDIDFDEFNEEDFDELGEKYLKRVYENVKGYKTTSGSIEGNKLKLEGLIQFKSGKEAKTSFVFESNVKTKNGKLKFLGENKQFAKGAKSFTLVGSLKESKLMIESLTYNYRARDTKGGRSQRLYGTVTKRK